MQQMDSDRTLRPNNASAAEQESALQEYTHDLKRSKVLLDAQGVHAFESMQKQIRAIQDPKQYGMKWYLGELAAVSSMPELNFQAMLAYALMATNAPFFRTESSSDQAKIYLAKGFAMLQLSLADHGLESFQLVLSMPDVSKEDQMKAHAYNQLAGKCGNGRPLNAGDEMLPICNLFDEAAEFKIQYGNESYTSSYLHSWQHKLDHATPTPQDKHRGNSSSISPNEILLSNTIRATPQPTSVNSNKKSAKIDEHNPSHGAQGRNRKNRRDK